MLFVSFCPNPQSIKVDERRERQVSSWEAILDFTYPDSKILHKWGNGLSGAMVETPLKIIMQLSPSGDN